ncbi:MAG: C39 family peptidase [Candidatus Atribacteria bacterium]|nr:C39 family peptidase [Candidatus Atribacteria bacterium]
MKKHRQLQSLILILLSLFILYTCIGCVGTVIEEIYLNVPIVKQEQDKWCLPASTKSVMNYYGMEITQKEIADYVIGEDGWGHNSLLVDNASKLGINAYNDYDVSLNKIKQELTKSKTMIVVLDYSLTDKTNHYYVIDGFDDTTQKLRLMCPKRGYIYWTYDDFKQLNNNLWIDEFGYGSDTFCITFVSPKNKSTIDNLTNNEKAIQIVREQTDLFNMFK